PMKLLRTLPDLNARVTIALALRMLPKLTDSVYDLLVRHPFDPTVLDVLLPEGCDGDEAAAAAAAAAGFTDPDGEDGGGDDGFDRDWAGAASLPAWTGTAAGVASSGSGGVGRAGGLAAA
ncbi:hypothetical protein HK405_014712, partial [Cladochytrium tenue]